MTDEEYLKGLERWRVDMDANLRRENDRLALAGLFWLQKGFNTFGSSRDCDIRLPKPAPRIIGAFEFDGANVTLTLDLGQSVEINGVTVTSATPLNSDEADSPSYVTCQSLRMVVIRRNKRVGVRLWDNCRPERESFPGRAWFDANEEFRVPAAYTPYPAPSRVALPNNLGEMEDDYMHGYISFRLLGRGHRLEAVELTDGRLYIQFRDTTNGFTTYTNGRYIYSDPVQEEGLLSIDFNRAFNPPSAFSAYSTSTFAHKRNMMKVPVEAGEKVGSPGNGL
ncbi:MAG TPA: DUF1684 domain-containing protein [Anaerolineales bacterium]|nr:DUF1684 domain-containing protein [Anaerolineales bacterium]